MKLTKLFGLATFAVAIVLVGCSSADNPAAVVAASAAVVDNPAVENPAIGNPQVVENYRVSNLRISAANKASDWGVLNGTGTEVLRGEEAKRLRVAISLGAGREGTAEEFNAIKYSIEKIEYERGYKASLNSAEDWHYYVRSHNGGPFVFSWENAAFNSLYIELHSNPHTDPVFGVFKYDVRVYFKDGTVEELSKIVLCLE